MVAKCNLIDPWGWKLDIESISASVYGGPMESFFDYLIGLLSQREIDEATVTDSKFNGSTLA
jgi:UDP-galactopyranose mutase